jgi:hypothetical protein
MLMPPHRASDKALSIACQSNLHKIDYALKLYANDYDDWFPPEKNGLELLVKLGYLDKEYLKCPLYNMEGGLYFYTIKNRRKGSDYVYIPGYKDELEVVTICYDKPKNHFSKDTGNTTNVLFTNSHVAVYDECDWKEEVAKYEKECNPSYKINSKTKTGAESFK